MQTLFTSINTQRSTKELVNCIYEQKVTKWVSVQVKLLSDLLRLAQLSLEDKNQKTQQLNIFLKEGRCVFLITLADIIYIYNNSIISFA